MIDRNSFKELKNIPENFFFLLQFLFSCITKKYCLNFTIALSMAKTALTELRLSKLRSIQNLDTLGMKCSRNRHNNISK